LWSFGAVGSHKPKEAHLSQDLIVLLSIGNVPASFFIELVKKALDNVCNMFKQWELAYKGIHFQVLIFSTHKISEYEVKNCCPIIPRWCAKWVLSLQIAFTNDGFLLWS
jgi:hypothetical protein